MINKDFAKEIAMAEEFIAAHNKDYKFMAFLRELKNGNYTHSEKWSEIYDFCEEHYPAIKSGIITGLAYHLETN